MSNNTFKKAFGISSTDQGHILSILRDKIYSDKVAAVVREYSTNAQDANIAANSSRPIEITLPNRTNQLFKVRDFGDGLTRKDIEEIYVKYGKSTRRGDATTTGQLGLGCKAAFAYGNEFFITSINGGLKSRYRAYIDATSHGVIELIKETKSKDLSGIEIEVKVRAGDTNSFHDRVGTLLKFFDPLPKLWNGPQIVFDEKFFLTGKAASRVWKFPNDHRGYRATPVAIMGGVPYPIDSYQITQNNGLSNDVASVLAYKCRIWFGPDELDFAASREDLEYTDKTRRAIRKAVKEVYYSLKKTMEDLIASQPTLLDAFRKYEELWHLHALMRSVAPVPVWGGVTAIRRTILDNAEITRAGLSLTDKFRIYRCGINRGSSRTAALQFRRTSDYSIEPWSADKVACIAQADVKSRWIVRAEQLHKSLITKECPNPTVYVLKGGAPEDAQKVIDHFNLGALSIKKLSEVKIGAATKRVKTIAAQYTKDAYVMDTVGSNTYPASSAFKPALIDLLHGTGIYVPIDRFNVKFRNHWENPNRIKLYVDIVEEAVGSRPPIYGVRIATADKHMGPGWMTFEDALKATVKKTLADNPALGKEIARRSLQNDVSKSLIQIVNSAQGVLDADSAFIKATVSIVNLDKESDESAIARKKYPKLFKWLEEALTQSNRNRYGRHRYYTGVTSHDSWVKDELGIPNLDNMDKKLGPTYPLLSELEIFTSDHYSHANNYRTSKTVVLKHILAYIRAVDENHI